MRQLLWRRAVDVVLIVIAIVLVGLVVATRQRATTSELAARARNLLGVFREESLARIAIERPTGRIVLTSVRGSADAGTNEHDGWQLVEPVEQDASAARMQDFLAALDHATVERRIEPDAVDRAQFGLDAPELVLSLEMGDVSYRLVFGREAPAPPGAVYVEVTGSGVPRRGVVLVDHHTWERLDVTLDDLREPQLLPYPARQLARIQLEGTGGKRRLRRDGSRWRFDGMQGDRRTDRTLTDLIVSALAGLSAEQPLEPRVAREALEGHPRVRVEATPSGDSPPVVLAVGGECPGRPGEIIVWRSAPNSRAACAPRYVFETLSTPAERLVATRLFSIAVGEVESVELTRAERRFDLVRRGSAFLLRKPQRAEVSLEAGDRRLADIVEARGTIVEDPDLATLGLAPPAGRAEVRTGGADETEIVDETVLLGVPGADGSLAVLRKVDHTVLEIDASSARALAPDATLVRPLEVFDFKPRQVRAVRVSGQLEQSVLQDGSGHLRLEAPASFSIDAGLAAKLISTLATLEAERWVADTPDPSFGLADPRLSVHLEIEESDGTRVVRRLRVGQPTVGGSFASVDGDEGVFVLARQNEELLAELVIDRSLLRMTPETTRGLWLRTPSADVRLERLGASFEQRSGHPTLSPGAIRTVIEAIEQLRAEAATQIGPAPPEAGLSTPVLRIRLERVSGELGPAELVIGAGDSWRGMSVHYARVSGVAATYVVARSLVREILDQL